MELKEIIEIATSAIGILLISMTILIVFLYRRMKNIQKKLAMATAAKYEMDDFLTEFSQGLESNDGLRESVNTICNYVARQIGAEGVAIYECSNGELSASGVAAVGAAVDTIVFSKDVKAQIGGAASVQAGKNIIVSADAGENFTTNVVAVGGSGVAAVNGSVSVVIVENAVSALVIA